LALTEISTIRPHIAALSCMMTIRAVEKLMRANYVPHR
jgi:hypothetical protein